ncbi:MAG: hypothetical protein LQ351_000510 [Letrouitia transgressa]|nr:MAG: hypothetical protein LQ351_000510 [Letrouitia transgressa]
MPTTIHSLPYEIISDILEYATWANARDCQQYSYGLNSVSDCHVFEGQHSKPNVQLIIRGQLSPDLIKWNATNNIRRVSRKWREWASAFALQELFIGRWRGGERWLQSQKLGTLNHLVSNEAVYHDPYWSLKHLALLFNQKTFITSSIRRLWFDGYYGPAEIKIIFDILQHCPALHSVTLPWTSLRYGSAELWSSLFNNRRQERRIDSLELLAVNLKNSQISDFSKIGDKRPLESFDVCFGGLKRLKLYGNSNLMPINDDDLVAISRTATGLREIHITGASSISVKGLVAVVQASKQSLRIIEHSPVLEDGFEHLQPKESDGGHLCHHILGCPHLNTLAISLPTICEDLFSDPSVNWAGDVQIRAGGLCGNVPIRKRGDQWPEVGKRILARARSLMDARAQVGVELNIEIFIGHWIFEPGQSLVHGDFALGEILSDGCWPVTKGPSSKGPYGQTDWHRKEEGPYSAISEEDFATGLRHGYISF